MKLNDLFRFAEMQNAFRRVERVMYANGTDRLENDAEHSYNLALLAWHIVEADKLDLDKDLVIRYALVHDLAEVYAGDTYIYSDDKEHLASKASREHEALEQLKAEFPETAEMFGLVERYESREDRESRFVYALDKIIPMIHIYLDQHGRMYREKQVTLGMLIENKEAKVALSPEIMPYWEELVALFREKESEIFG